MSRPIFDTITDWLREPNTERFMRIDFVDNHWSVDLRYGYHESSCGCCEGEELTVTGEGADIDSAIQDAYRKWVLA